MTMHAANYDQIYNIIVFMTVYILLMQMGSTMKSTIFNDRVATALKNWHHMAKKNTKQSHHSETNSPFSSRPATPTHGMSPVHLLQNYHHSSLDSLHSSPRRATNVVENDRHWDIEEIPSSRPNQSDIGVDDSLSSSRHSDQQERPTQEPRIVSSSSQLPPGPGAIRTQHEINMNSSDFTFR